MTDRFRRFLLHPRFAWFLAAIAFLVHAPTLGAGYLIDDLAHRYFAQGHVMPGGPRGMWDLYRFADGGAGTHEAMANGMHPWWTDPSIKLAFFRPVTSVLRYVEEAVFGDHAVGPHLVSCLIFVGLTLAVLRLLRAWIGGAAASLGALLFALDDSHATTVVWIAARHAMVGTLFVVLGLGAFLEARRAGRVPLLAAIFFGLGLCSSEAALGGAAYFAALAFVPAGRGDDLRARAVSLAPIAGVLAAWAAIYVVGHYGASGSAFYIDPAATPIRFLVAAATRAPTLALSQIFFPPAEISSFAPAIVPVVVALGYAASALLVALSVRAFGARVALPLAFAFLVSILPGCGTIADDRTLVLPGVALFGLLGLWGRHAYRHRGALLRVAAGTGFVVHVVLAIPLGPLRGMSFATMFGGLVERGAASIPTDEALTKQHLVMLTAPDGLLTSGMGVLHVLRGQPIPIDTRVLVGAPPTPVAVTRPADDTLVLVSEGGAMRDPFVGAYRSTPFVAGERVVVGDLTVEVRAAKDGFPTEMVFRFREPPTETTHRFLAWKDHGFVEVALPRVGEAITLPAIVYDQVLAGPKR